MNAVPAKLIPEHERTLVTELWNEFEQRLGGGRSADSTCGLAMLKLGFNYFACVRCESGKWRIIGPGSPQG